MPAASVENVLVLPRIPEPPGGEAAERPVVKLVTGQHLFEGAGFPVCRPFPGPAVSLRETDPFLLLDQMGEVDYAPGEARGAPWHPHRGFETVTYLLDGRFQHRDSHGGGGLIGEGDTQWMTAGSGILHDEMPPDDLVRSGGRFHGVQLWVNLPSRLKWTPPRYQAIQGHDLTMLTSSDGGALVRLVAGEMAGYKAPGVTWTPIDYAHVTVSPGALVRMPWRPDFSALVYVLTGQGTVGRDRTAIHGGQLAILGPGAVVALTASRRLDGPSATLEALILGGVPLREPIAHYGPFVMNTADEIVQAFEDYQAGRMGTAPATVLSGGAAL